MAINAVQIWLNVVLFALLARVSITATEYRGFVELDDLSFDKVVNKFSAVLVKFDIAFPYGEKHETFAKFAEQLTGHIDDFLVAAVGIKDYGELENSKLGERFNVGIEYPVIKLFRDGKVNEWVDYPNGMFYSNEHFKFGRSEVVSILFSTLQIVQ